MRGPATARAPVGEALRHRFRAGIVEAHAIDERFIRDGAKHARRGIAGLRVPCDAAKFAEAEAERRPDRRGGGVLVHARREADRIGEIQAKNFHRQFRGPEEGFARVANQFVPARPRERRQRAIVDFLRVLREQRRTDEISIKPRHAKVLAARPRRRNAKVNGKTGQTHKNSRAPSVLPVCNRQMSRRA